jgi:AhpC/TSA family protein
MTHTQADIYAPEFPPSTTWVNAAFMRMGTLLGRNAALVWFWDYTNLNSIRALPYLREWHSRYSRHGLKVIGVHSPQFEFGKDPARVEEAAARLDIPFPIAADSDYAIWRLYGTEVWPSLYLWDRRGTLSHHHFAEGGYRETELAIHAALREIEPDVELPDPMAPLRPTDAPGALVEPPTPHQYLEPDRSGRPIGAGEQLSIRYGGASAAAVLDGSGGVEVLLNGEWINTFELEGPRLYEVVDTGHHQRHELTLVFDAPATAYAFSFAPGVAVRRA